MLPVFPFLPDNSATLPLSAKANKEITNAIG